MLSVFVGLTLSPYAARAVANRPYPDLDPACQASKLRGTVIFMVGFFFVFTGHPVIGLAVEVFGFLNLFG